MQCIWSSTAKAFRQCGNSTAFKWANATPRLTKFGTQVLLPTLYSRAKLSSFSVASKVLSTAIRDTSISPSSLSISFSNSLNAEQNEQLKRHQKIAQLSRAAGKCARMACKDSSLDEVFVIIRSLKLSQRRHRKSDIGRDYQRFEGAIDFKLPVSPRFALHCLLHGLLRRGYTKKAGKLASQMTLEMQMKVNEKTMVAVTNALCLTDINAIQQDEGFRDFLRSAREKLRSHNSRPPDPTGSMMQSSCTRIAYRLFCVAKLYRKQRTEQMFQQIIDACLLQGEIIVVSFLIALLLKQWQLRYALADEETQGHLIQTGKIPEIDLFPIPNLTNMRWKRELSNLAKLPCLDSSLIFKALEYIKATMLDTPLPDPHALRPTLEEAGQALAIIAETMEGGSLPSHSFPKVIRMLATFPSHPDVVIFVRRNMLWTQMHARKYFDEVLGNLSSKLLESPSEAGKDRRLKPPWAQLDSRAYNALLYYALRTQMSPALGESIYTHMLESGGAISPTIHTYNIILRAGTLMRRHDIASKSFHLLHEIPKDPMEFVSCLGGDMRNSTQLPDSTQECYSFVDDEHQFDRDTAIQYLPGVAIRNFVNKLSNEPFNIRSEESLLPEHLHASIVTIINYTLYLIAQGKPEQAVRFVYSIFPFLSFSYDQRNVPIADRAHIKRERVKQAIKLGPHFFTVLLTALRKAHMTSLAERIWFLAKKAEEQSWDPDFANGTNPWCLPIAAYTIMLQCYTAEARKCFHRLRWSASGRNERNTVDLHKDWSPRELGPYGGWGYLAERAAQSQGLGKPDRYNAARWMAIFILHSTFQNSQDVPLRLIAASESTPSSKLKRVQPPIPDERFYNAALDLFGRLPNTYVRRTRSQRSYHRRMNRRAETQFINNGQIPLDTDPILSEIVVAMHKAGYHVPEAYRSILIGRRTLPMQEKKLHPREPLPWQGPHSSGCTTYRLTTRKTRGLPVRRTTLLTKKLVQS